MKEDEATDRKLWNIVKVLTEKNNGGSKLQLWGYSGNPECGQSNRALRPGRRTT